MIRFRCECGKKLKAEETIIGRKVRCTRCEKINIVPHPDSSLVIQNGSRTSPNHVLAPEREPETPVSLLVSPRESSSADNSLPEDQSRFKLAPEFDPEPGDSFRGTPGTIPTFEFDLPEVDPDTTEPALIQVDTAKPPSRRESLLQDSDAGNGGLSEPELPTIQTDGRPKFQSKPASRFPLALMAGAIVAGLALLIGFGYLLILLTSGTASFPESFEKRADVQNYRNAALQLEKTRRTLVIMGDAYIGSKSPDPAEIEQIKAYQNKIETALDPNPTLQKALDLVNNGREAEATRLLNQAAQSLLDQRPEMAAKTLEYTKKSR